MAWDNLTLILFGFSLYTLGLLLRSRSIRRLHFANFIDVSKINEIPISFSFPICITLFIASFSLFGWAISRSISKDYSAFLLLLGLGILLVAIRTFCFFCPKISILGFEIESVTDPKPNLSHISHSPFIIGGVILILLGGATPLTFEVLLHRCFQTYQRNQFNELENKATKVGFKKLYKPRMLVIRGIYEREDEFLDSLTPGRHYVIKGRAGVGKSWFLMSIRYHFNKFNRGKENVICLEAKNISCDKTIFEQINHSIFGGFDWFSQPAARSIICDKSTLVLIDGFDEVAFGNRKEIENKLNEFSSSNNDNTIILPRQINISNSIVL